MSRVVTDFDLTLVKRDTLLAFARHLLGAQGRGLEFGRVVARFLWWRAGPGDEAGFKDWLARLLFAGRSSVAVAAEAEIFFETQVQPTINRCILQRVQAAAPGGEVLVVSTNFEVVITPLAALLPGVKIAANALEQVEGRFTGRIARRVVSGKDKLVGLQQHWRGQSSETTVGFGDSATDAPFMRLCTEAFWVRRTRGRWRGRAATLAQLGGVNPARLRVPPDDDFILVPQLR